MIAVAALATLSFAQKTGQKEKKATKDAARETEKGAKKVQETTK
jgi:hypothetical protein